MKKINYKYILILLVLVFVSCDEDTNDFIPETAPVTIVSITPTQSNDSQCALDVTMEVMEEATLYYDVLFSSDEAPSSDDLFSSGDSISFEEAGSQTVSLSNLQEGWNITIYAISVNIDGIRSERVFTANYVQPNYEVNTDTSYTGDSSSPDIGLGPNIAPAFTANFTPQPGVDNTWTIESAWGPDFVDFLAGAGPGSFPYPALLTINSDLSVTVTSLVGYGSGGTGEYDPCTNTISYTLEQLLFTTPFTVDVVLTPDNL